MAKQIETLSELMAVVQGDLEAVRDGRIDLAKARLLKDFHKLLLKGAELNLSYQRMERGKQPNRELRLIALPEKEKKDDAA
jgi:hypothetical protein